MKYLSCASNDFWKLFDALPADVQRQAEKQFDLFRHNPFHPSLRLKPVAGVWAARVNKVFALWHIAKEITFYWFWIGSHDDYEKLLER